ncbi:hypothetical protein DERF_004023 [Dermatophagoides farinae]|uniref:Uncharacterized protein n=1 Tax=Dermatophagoides farinae TaxID=6954 RepID=A0A922LDR6_DERFA|nr:hypothetical protein DERF_004023 [Dermatophagoides farinae]
MTTNMINMMRSPDNKNHEWNLQPFSLANCREKKIFPNPSTTIKRHPHHHRQMCVTFMMHDWLTAQKGQRFKTIYI